MYAEVEKIVSEHFGVSIEEIQSGGRGVPRNVSDARHFTWYILYHVLGFKGKPIARRYNVTQRSILLSVATLKDGVRMQSFYANHYRQLQKQLRMHDII